MKISQRSMRTTRRSVAWTVVVAALLLLLLAVSAAQAAVTTDQADYAPGTVVTILGNNVGLMDPWMPGRTVTVQVVGPYGYQFEPLTTTVGFDGAWSRQFTLLANPLVAVGDYTYTASAEGSFKTQSGTFSDGSVLLSVNADPAAAEGGYFTIQSYLRNTHNDWGPFNYPTNWTSPNNQKVQSDGSFTITGISTDVGAYSYVGWTYKGVPHDASVAIDRESNAGFDSTLTLRYDRLPALTAIPDQTTSWGSQLTFTASATDADGDPLTFGLSGQPSGASMTSGGAFTWTPTKAQLAGSLYSFSVTVNDTKATVSTPVKVTVTKRSLTVTADTGQGKVYGAGDPALTWKLTDGSLVTGDSISGDLARVAGENVGPYAINQGSLSAGTNYNITYVGADFTISARPITVTAAILPPINSDGSSVFKLGSTVPVKFKLTGFGAGIANATIKITKISSGVDGTDLELVNSNPASTGNAFRYDASSDQYIYNWGTKNVTPTQGPYPIGTYRIDIMLGGVVVGSVEVSLRK